MANLSASVAKIIQRQGQACRISFKAVGSGSSAVPARTITGSIRIGQRTTAVESGQLVSAVKAIMAPVGRSLQDATITVGTRTFIVVSAVETVDAGQPVIIKLVLR